MLLASVLAPGDAPGDTTTYTFAGVTSPSLTHVAREFEVDVDDPEDPPSASDIDSLTDDGTASGTPDLRAGLNGYAGDAEASQGQYDNIESSDNNRWTITDPGSGDNACFWAKFEIAEAPSIISQIDVKLEGYQGAATDKAWLGIWRAGAATPYWEVLEASQQTSDYEYTGSITSSCDEYIDDGGDLYVIFFNEDDDDSLYVDYVEVKTTWSCGNGMFGYLRTLTIESDLVGTDSSGTLPATGFPVLVSLDAASSGNWLKNVRETGGRVEHPKGYDIIFRDSSKNTLYHEIEEYDGATGTLVAWVRVDSLSKSADTTIYILYGNDCIRTATEVPASVWDSNYVGVWHLEEEVTDEETTGTHYDSTGSNDGSQSGNEGVAGKIAGAQDLDGTTSAAGDYIDAGTSPGSATDLTIEFWMKSHVDDQYMRPVSKEAKDDAGDQGWCFLVRRSGDAGYDRALIFRIGDETDYGGWGNEITAEGLYAANQWVHVVGTFSYNGSNGGTGKLYVGGSEVASKTNTDGRGVANTDKACWIGWSYGIYEWPSPTEHFDGLIDEVRISNTDRDADWIKTCFNNQDDTTIGANKFINALGSEVSGPVTLVTLGSFTARGDESGSIRLRWRTAQEIRNLGFHIWRGTNPEGPFMKITESLIRARTFSVRGRAYSFEDTGAIPGVLCYYELEDIDIDGMATLHGPICADRDGDGLPDDGVTAFDGEDELPGGFRRKAVKGARRRGVLEKARALSPRSRRAAVRAARLWRIASRRKMTPLDIQKILAASPSVKIRTGGEGWYRIFQEDLLEAGLDPLVDPRHLGLFSHGREVPLLFVGEGDGRLDPGDALEFYGLVEETTWSGDGTYWLADTGRSGRRIRSLSGWPFGSRSRRWIPPRSVPRNFPFTVEERPREIYFAALKNGDAENFFGPLLLPESPLERVIRVPCRDLSSALDALLRVDLQGVSEEPHRVAVFLNGLEVGGLEYFGRSRGEASVPVSGDLLLDGENVVTLLGEGGELDLSLLDAIRLTYSREYRADGESLKFTAPGLKPVTVGGFGSGRIRVVDVTDPGRAFQLKGLVRRQGGEYSVTVLVRGLGMRTLLAFTDEGMLNSGELSSNAPSLWKGERWGAEVVIVTHGDFLESAELLADFRRDQGWTVEVIEVEDLYDEYNFGKKSPHALREFLRDAREHWKRKPRFLIILGDASFDPRDYRGLGETDLVPTKLVETALLETASDDWFADLDGDGDGDGVPEMAVGRLPARTPEEASLLVEKVLGYELEDPGPWSREVLLVADADDGYDFESASRNLAGLLPADLNVRGIFRGQEGGTREDLLSSLNEGALLVGYLGHGSVEVWKGLLGAGDARSLNNGARLPLVMSMTCLNGYFQDPELESLAEALLLSGTGGAVAVWASSGLTEPGGQVEMSEEFLRGLFGGENLTIGEAALRAKAAVQDRDVRRSWILLGDPTTRIR